MTRTLHHCDKCGSTWDPNKALLADEFHLAGLCESRPPLVRLVFRRSLAETLLTVPTWIILFAAVGFFLVFGLTTYFMQR